MEKFRVEAVYKLATKIVTVRVPMDKDITLPNGKCVYPPANMLPIDFNMSRIATQMRKRTLLTT